MSASPFQQIPPEAWLLSNALAFAVFDGFPVSRGHTLVLTKRLVPTWFDATAEEQAALMALVNEAKEHLDKSLDPKPDGYNVGFNCGETAGQTVMHVHVHVIPRYSGDVPDPRGGVRFVIPAKANYLTKQEAAPLLPSAGGIAESSDLRLSTGHPDSRLWDRLSTRMAGARLVDILASFVQLSGLDVIERRLFEVLRGEATIRILISDYLYISDPRALDRLLAWREAIEADDENCGVFRVRLVQLGSMEHKPESFHPKAWRIVDELGALVAVGSSNLSRPALVTGVEWNLLCSSVGHEGIPNDFTDAFDSLWDAASNLSSDLVEQYRSSAKKYRSVHFEPESLDTADIPEPRAWQLEALQSLERMRATGYRRALLAVATGMGKTWLAAFDVRQLGQQLNRRPRVLVIAHRSHILAQAETVLSNLLENAFGKSKEPEANTSWYIGSRSDLSGNLVVASIQKLARPEGLMRLAAMHFDYAIVDEVHHAEAPTYRRVLAKLNADFTLGLTATPERADGVDVVSIFDDNLAYQASIGDGIDEGALVPFHYLGIRDTVDFSQIPWRNGRFDQDELERRVAVSERMDRLWHALKEHPGQRTIVFCCSRRHALFARDWLRSKGLTASAVFSGDGGDSYGRSLEQLREGKLETLCVVDMFNEGLDVPAVDRVVMLRPTESKVVFLQQLGRGLRATVGKTRLLVIDFVGNHRVFARRMLHLLSLGGDTASFTDLKNWIDGDPPVLPAGCLLDVELEARDVLRQFLPTGAAAGIEAYRGMRDELGRRPMQAELIARGYNPGTISRGAGSWFEFTNHEGDLNESEQQVVASLKKWLRTVETTSLNKSYKMVVLRVLLDQSSFFETVKLSQFAKQCRRYMLEHPILQRDLLEGKHAVDHQNASDKEWTAWWIKWPIDRWLDEQNGHRWFTRNGEHLSFAVNCSDNLRQSLEAMTEELVDGRLARYIQSKRLQENAKSDSAFTGKVSHASGRPILFIPDKTQQPDRPVGPTEVQLPDGTVWIFKFVKVACNVALPVGQNMNQLSDLLRHWFGTDAGLPGTNFHVGFESQNGRWHASPLGAAPVAEGINELEGIRTTDFSTMLQPSVAKSAKYNTHVPVFDLVAAAGGFGDEGVPQEIGWIEVTGHKLKPGMFAAQVVGESMQPRIPSGSLCLFGPCPAGSRQGRLLLVQLNTFTDPEDGGRYTVKRYHSTKRSNEYGWEHQTIELQPFNPDFSLIQVDEQSAADLRVLGEFLAVLS